MSLFNDLREMQRSIDSISNALMVPGSDVWDVEQPLLGGGGGRGTGRELTTRGGKQRWSPSVDVKDTDKAVVLHAELPGIPRDQIKLSVDGNRLIIEGEKKTKKKDKGENWIRKERSYGRFYRAITLPSGVDVRNVQANYDHGLLEVVVPKNPELGKHRIEIGAKSAEQQPVGGQEQVTGSTGTTQQQQHLQQQQQQTDLGKKPVEVPITGGGMTGSQPSQGTRV